MKYLPLVWAGLRRKSARSLFTLLSIVVAFVVFGMLQGVNAGIAKVLSDQHLDRLLTDPRVPGGAPMPVSGAALIEKVPGVTAVAQRAIFFGFYQDAKNGVFALATDVPRWFIVRPEYIMPKAQHEALANNRTGIALSAKMAARLGIKVGDKFPVISSIAKADGGKEWAFEVVGIFDDPDNPLQANMGLINYAYFDEARAADKGTADRFIVRIKDPNRAAATAAAIDGLFANSTHETRTQSEKEATQSQLKQVGDIGFFTNAIVAAVFFTLLFLTANTMMQSVRERIPEFAVLKTMGFSDSGVFALVVVESVVLCVIAAVIGLGLATALFPRFKDILQISSLSWVVIVSGLIAALIVAFISSVVPAWRVKRLRITDALLKVDMSMLTQIAAVSGLNLRNIPLRLGTSLVIVIGIAGVVAVLISVLAMSTGFKRTVSNSGRADRAIILSQGADSEASSNLSRSDVPRIGDAPGVAKSGAGRPLASAEALIVAPVARKSDGSDAYVTLRGIGPEGFAVRPELKLVAGKMFRPAVHELLVGESAQKQFKNLQIGDRVVLREGEWTVVGTFSSGGDSHDSELIADADTVLSAYRLNAFKSMTVQLESEQSFGLMKDALTSDPMLKVEVKREQEYFAGLSRPLNRLLDLVAYVIGSIMAVGALFGALNTMYSAVSTRSTEIAMLRAIGFGGGAVVVSVFLEALMLALLGAGLGVTIAYLAFNGNAISTVGGAFGNSQLVYSLSVTPSLMAIGVALACVIGFLGGLFPAVRAARLPVASALRAS